MFATGFCLDPESTTKNEPQRTELFLSDLAREMESWVIGGMTYPAKEIGKAYNTAVTFDPNGQSISVYKKIHPIPILGRRQSSPEGRTIENLSIGSFNVTPAICYDLRFPELFRSALHSGTNLFVVLGCWPKSRINHWVTLLKARAIENQSYVVGVNRIGKDKDLEYGGRTMVVSPLGEILADGAERKE
jgi:predicted amidohydrolase